MDVTCVDSVFIFFSVFWRVRGFPQRKTNINPRKYFMSLSSHWIFDVELIDVVLRYGFCFLVRCEGSAKTRRTQKSSTTWTCTVTSTIRSSTTWTSPSTPTDTSKATGAETRSTPTRATVRESADTYCVSHVVVASAWVARSICDVVILCYSPYPIVSYCVPRVLRVSCLLLLSLSRVRPPRRLRLLDDPR